MNANIMKHKFFIKLIIKYHINKATFYVIVGYVFFLLYDLILTLTYVLLDNFSPCFTGVVRCNASMTRIKQ